MLHLQKEHPEASISLRTNAVSIHINTLFDSRNPRLSFVENTGATLGFANREMFSLNISSSSLAIRVIIFYA